MPQIVIQTKGLQEPTDWANKHLYKSLTTLLPQAIRRMGVAIDLLANAECSGIPRHCVLQVFLRSLKSDA